MRKILFILSVAFTLCLTLCAQTRLVVNTGTTANDGTGDSTRTAFNKVNTNFNTLWAVVYTNGIGPTSANVQLQLDNRVMRVATLAALKALPAVQVVSGALVSTAGYTTAGDGGGGLYRYDASSTATANDGSVILPAHGTGRYLLQHSGEVNLRQFGARGDTSIGWLRNVSGAPTPTDDAPALQTAVNFCGENGVKLQVPNGRYFIGSTVSNRSYTGVTIEGVSESVALTGQYTSNIVSQQTTFIRNGNYTMLLFAGALTSAEMTNNAYLFGLQRYAKVSNLLIQDANRGVSVTNPCVALKRSMLSRWHNVEFSGIGSTSIEMWTADDAIFTNCRWLAGGFQGFADTIIHRTVTVGSEPEYVLNNTLTFVACNWEGSYKTAIQIPESDTSGDASTIIFTACTVKNSDHIAPGRLIDIHRGFNVRFDNFEVVFDPTAITTNSTLDSIVRLSQSYAFGSLNVYQLGANPLVSLTNAVLIQDPRDSFLTVNIGSPLAASIAGDTLVSVRHTDVGRNRFRVSGKSFVTDAAVEFGAYQNKPYSDWPQDDLVRRFDGNTATFNGSEFASRELGGQNLGTNDFTVAAVVEVPRRSDVDYGVWMLTDSVASPPAASNSSLALLWDNGVLRLRHVSGSGSAVSIAAANAVLMRRFSGQTVPIYVIRRSGLFEVWIAGSRILMSGTQPALSEIISATARLLVGYANDGSASYARQAIPLVEIFNYAFDAAGIERHMIMGADAADIQGTTIPAFSATFDTGVESFTGELSATFATNSIGQAVLTLVGSGSSGAFRTASLGSTPNARYRIDINARLASGTAALLYAGFANNGGFDTSTNSTFSFTPTGDATWFSGVIGRHLQNSGAFRIRSLASNGSSYEIDGISVVRLGRILSHEMNSRKRSTQQLSEASNVATINAGGSVRSLSFLNLASVGDTTLAWQNESEGDFGVIYVNPDTTARIITLPSLAYSPTGSTITNSGGTGSTNWTRLVWEVHQVGGTNRIFVQPTEVYR